MEDDSEVQNEAAYQLNPIDGDGERMNELAAALSRRLIAVCRSRTPLCATAEDIVQETLRRLYAQSFKLGNEDPFPFALGILRNVIREAWRNPELKNETQYDPENPSHQGMAPGPDVLAEKVEYQQHLKNCLELALQLLPQKDRVLYETYKNLPFHSRVPRAELAASLGMKRSAFTTKISRLSSKLQESIKKCMKKVGLRVQ